MTTYFNAHHLKRYNFILIENSIYNRLILDTMGKLDTHERKSFGSTGKLILLVVCIISTVTTRDYHLKINIFLKPLFAPNLIMRLKRCSKKQQSFNYM